MDKERDIWKNMPDPLRYVAQVADDMSGLQSEVETYDFVTLDEALSDPKYDEMRKQNPRFMEYVKRTYGTEYDLYGDLAASLKSHGFAEEAEKYEQCLLDHIDKVEAKNGLAWYYLQAFDAAKYSDGLRMLEEVVQEHYDDNQRSFAATRLFYAYYYGDGVVRDWKKAIELIPTIKLYKDAFKENPEIMLNMADIYAIGGHGVPRNVKKAKAWFTLAKQSTGRIKKLAKDALVVLKRGTYGKFEDRICFMGGASDWSDYPWPANMHIGY